MTTKEIQDNIVAYNLNMLKAMEAKIDALRKFQNVEQMMTERVMAKVPAIEEVLSKLNLSISDFTFYKTNSDGITGVNVWNEKDQMNISITAVPANEKFKFIKRSGYTKSGAGKNQLQLSAKAGTLASTIKNATGLQTNINEFSLEADEDVSKNRVLISMWVNQ